MMDRGHGANLARIHHYSFVSPKALQNLMTTESLDFKLTSHPAFWQYSVPITILGC